MVIKKKASETSEWTFLSNHAHVLICIARQPDIRLSELADLVGIQERTAHRIIHELSDAGYVSVTKVGRNNVYEIDLNHPLRHPLESDHDIREIIFPLLKKKRAAS
jgi:DNA-binding IclR family transcriptional regulator